MKTLITILLLIPLISFGQIKTNASDKEVKKFTIGAYCKRNIASWSLMVGAGIADGVVETLRHDYASFDATFNANDAFWNPSVSWKNKYKNDDPMQGPAYPGSTTWLAWTTDGYHLMRTVNKTCVVAAITVKITGRPQKWYVYFLDFATHSIMYSIGFNLSYELIRK